MPAAWPPGKGPQAKFSASRPPTGSARKQQSSHYLLAKPLCLLPERKEHGEARARLRTDLARAAAQAPPPPRQTPRPLPPPRGAPQPAPPSPAAFSRCCTAYTYSACATSPNKDEGSILAFCFLHRLWRVSDCPQLVICLFAGSSAEARFFKRAVGLLRVPSSAPDTSCFSSWGYTPAEAGRTASAAGNKQGEGRSDGRVLEATFSVVALLPSGPDETRITISAHQCLILRNATRKMNPFWGNRSGSRKGTISLAGAMNWRRAWNSVGWW